MMLHATKRFACFVLAGIGLLSFVAMTTPIAFAQSTISSDGVIESKVGGFKFPDGTVQKTSAVAGGSYAIGGIGPAGGFVYFVTADGLHGMEAAPSDSGPATGTKWGCQGTQVGAFARGIGSGARNTDAILRGCAETDIAAALADELANSSGYFDWHLPTKFDLNLMYLLLHSQGLGNFCGTCFYWSSSEVLINDAWGQYFDDGEQGNLFRDLVSTGGLPARVRAVRSF